MLRTERLLLREFTMDDTEDLYRLESIPEVVRFQKYPPRSREEARQVVSEIVQGQRELPRRHIEWAVFLENQFIGRVGCWLEAGEAALWYAFLPSHHGQGYAAEAVRALLDRLIQERRAERFVIECDPRNRPSWRLAERLGFTRESLSKRAFECKGEWVDSLVYAKTL